MFTGELWRTCAYAFPIALSQVSFMMMGVVDSIMLGRLGARELASTSIARALFWILAAFCMGVLTAVDVINAQHSGLKAEHERKQLLLHGMRVALIIGIIATIVLQILCQILSVLDLDPIIINQARIYLQIVSCGVPLLTVFSVLQKYWQIRGVTVPILFLVVIANGVNYFLNRAFIFGDFGFSALGIAGAALSTNCSRGFMLIVLLLVTVVVEKNFSYRDCVQLFDPRKINLRFVRNVCAVGVFAGFQHVFEVGVFSCAAILSARIGTAQAAAHHIMMMIVSLSFMFPLGLSHAASFRVGYFVGAGKFNDARRSGNLSTLIAASTITLLCIVLYVYQDSILLLFSRDQAVVKYSEKLLPLAIIYMFFDSIQTCIIGALRGVGNTKAASIVSAIGYYPAGIFLGAILCFYFALGLWGLWFGLMFGMVAINVMIIPSWLRHSRKPIVIYQETRREMS